MSCCWWWWCSLIHHNRCSIACTITLGINYDISSRLKQYERSKSQLKLVVVILLLIPCRHWFPVGPFIRSLAQYCLLAGYIVRSLIRLQFSEWPYVCKFIVNVALYRQWQQQGRGQGMVWLGVVVGWWVKVRATSFNEGGCYTCDWGVCFGFRFWGSSPITRIHSSSQIQPRQEKQKELWSPI